jgi:hypothetical protein
VQIHTTILDMAGIADYRSVLGYFTQTIMKDLRLVSGYDVLYGKIKVFVQSELFDRKVELDSPNTLRNLSELFATKTLIENFKKAVNALTVKDKGDSEIRDTIKLRQTRRQHTQDLPAIFKHLHGVTRQGRTEPWPGNRTEAAPILMRSSGLLGQSFAGSVNGGEI